MSKHLTIIFFVIIVVLVAILGGCTQPSTEQPEEKTTPAQAASTVTPVANPSATTTMVSTPSAIITPRYVEETPGLLIGSSINLENAPKLKSAYTISVPGATDFLWCENGQSLCVGSPGEVVVYKLEATVASKRLAASNPKLLSVAPSGDTLAWVENDSQIRIWDLKQSSDQTIDTQAESVIDLIFDPTGTKLVASIGDQSIQNWRLNGDQADPLINYPGWLVDLDFSPDGEQMAGASQDEFATIIFDAASGSEQSRLVWVDHASPVLYGAFFSPDWKTLAWVARGTIQLMDVQSEELGPMLGHEDFIVSTAWSPSSELIAAAAAGTVGGEYKPLITLWDPTSGQSVASLVHDSPLLQIAFSPDGSQLVSLDADGKVNIWIVTED